MLKLPDVTPILGTREYICGVIPMRGSVVPAVDLKPKFGQGTSEVEPMDKESTAAALMQMNQTIAELSNTRFSSFFPAKLAWLENQRVGSVAIERDPHGSTI